MIGASRVDYIAVPTNDVARAEEFYANVLGLEKNPNSLHDWIEFEAGNVTLALWRPEADGEQLAPNTAGFALRVADVASARQQLVSAGVEFLGGTVDTGVCHMAFLLDPDGNTVILHRRYA